MSQQTCPPISHWLCQLVAPLWTLSFCLVLTRLTKGESRDCQTGSAMMLLGFYGLLQCLGNVRFVRGDMGLHSALTLLTAGFALPLMIGVTLHHGGNEAIGGLWQELIIPTIIVIWTGAAACFSLIWSGTSGYAVRARWAVPLSVGTVLLAFQAFYEGSLLLNGIVCLYGLPILLIGVRDAFRPYAVPS